MAMATEDDERFPPGWLRRPTFEQSAPKRKKRCKRCQNEWDAPKTARRVTITRVVMVFAVVAFIHGLNVALCTVRD